MIDKKVWSYLVYAVLAHSKAKQVKADKADKT